MARLRSETNELQHRLEAELDLLGTQPSWLDYRLYLFRMYGFHVSVERALAAVPGLTSVVPDAQLRNNKVALIAHDLVSLGVDRRDLAALPRAPMPTFEDLSEALGWMFVLERATLDGKGLIDHLSESLPLEMQSAAAYLNCYGQQVTARWRELGQALDRYARTDEIADRIAAAALDSLTKLTRWLRPSEAIPSRSTVQQRAAG